MTPRKKPDAPLADSETNAPNADTNRPISETETPEREPIGANSETPVTDEMLADQSQRLDESVDRLSQSISERVFIVEEDWSRLMALLATVEETESELNDAKEAASAAKKAHDTAQAALQRALGRMRDGLRASQEPELPFDAPAGIPEPSPEGLPYDGIHQSDVEQSDAHDDKEDARLTMAPEEQRRQKVLATSAWLIERGWKRCTPEMCEGYSDAELDALLAWARGDTDVPEIAGLTVDAAPAE